MGEDPLAGIRPGRPGDPPPPPRRRRRRLATRPPGPPLPSVGFITGGRRLVPRVPLGLRRPHHPHRRHPLRLHHLRPRPPRPSRRRTPRRHHPPPRHGRGRQHLSNTG